MASNETLQARFEAQRRDRIRLQQLGAPPVPALSQGNQAYAQRYQGQTLSAAARSTSLVTNPITPTNQAGLWLGNAQAMGTAGGVGSPAALGGTPAAQNAYAARYTGLAGLPQQQQTLIGTPGATQQGQRAMSSPQQDQIRAANADAARYTMQAIAFGQFPNLMSPGVAAAMGWSEEERVAHGYNPNWPYNRVDNGSTGGGGGGDGRGGSRAGGGFAGFGGGGIETGLYNWRVGS